MIKVVPKLNKVLKERGLNQYDLAQMTGLQQGTISRFDRSRQHSSVNLILISQALNIHMEELFEVIEEGDAN